MDAPGVARLGYPHSEPDRVLLTSETEPGLGWSFLDHTFGGVDITGSHGLGIGHLPAPLTGTCVYVGYHTHLTDGGRHS